MWSYADFLLNPAQYWSYFYTFCEKEFTYPTLLFFFVFFFAVVVFGFFGFYIYSIKLNLRYLVIE